MTRTRFLGVLLAGALAACGDDSTPPRQGDGPAARADSAPPTSREASAGLEASTPGKEAGSSTARLGEPCTAATTCEKGGSGIAKCRTTWPDGYCLVEGCSATAMDCPGDPGMGRRKVGAGKCVLAPTPTCLLMCGTENDCRPGYQCAEKADAMGHGNVKVCIPK